MNNITGLLATYKYIKERKFLSCSSSCFFVPYDNIIEKGMLKSLIVAIYADWESYVKSRISDFFRENKKHIYDNVFLKKYLDVAISNSYTRNTLIDSFIIEEGFKINLDIKKEILCASNNMTIKEFMNILGRLNFDVEEFKSRINDGKSECFEKLRTSLKQLWNLGLEIQKAKAIDSLEEFFKILVDTRNSISHTFICDESFTPEQLKIFIEIVINMKDILNRNLAFKSMELEFHSELSKFDEITFEKVIKSNKGDGNYTSIIHIQSGKNKFKNNDCIIIKNKSKICPGKILKIKDKKCMDVDVVECDKDYSLEIDTDISIQKSSKLEMFCKTI